MKLHINDTIITDLYDMIVFHIMMQYMEDIWLIWLYYILYIQETFLYLFQAESEIPSNLTWLLHRSAVASYQTPWIIDSSGSQVLGNVGPPSRSSARCVFSSWSIAALSWFPTAGHVTGKPRKQKDSTVQTLTNLELQWTTNNEPKSRD